MKLYFSEIKNRLILVFILQSSTLLSLYYYKISVLFTFVSPILKLGESMLYFIFTSVTEPFSVYLNLTFFINKQLVIVYFLYHFFIFLLPALYKLEFKNLFLLNKILFIAWVFSAFVANLVLIPWTWLFFLDFYSTGCDTNFNTYFESRLVEYLDFYTSFYWVNFLYFQFIGVLFFVLNLPKTTLKFVTKYRKIFFFFFFLLAAIVCPDACSQLIFVAVLISTYELSLFGKLLNFG
jgi:sec-independent protein translocase protein TatC